MALDPWGVKSVTPSSPAVDPWGSPADASSQAGGTLSAAPERQGFLSSAADSSGLSSLGNLVAHPIDTVKGIPSAIGQELSRSGQQFKTAWNTPNNQPMKAVDNAMYALPFIGGPLQKADTQYAAGNPMGAAGTMAGLGGAALIPEAAGERISTLAAPLKKAGGGFMDMAIGAGKKEFKRGAQPGSAYLEAGGTPAISISSLADKAQNVKQGIGQKLGQAYSDADAAGTMIPSNTVRAALNPDIDEAINTTMGPGGSMDPSQYIKLSQSYDPMLQAGDAAGGIKPSELFAAKKNVAQNTSWSDPAALGLKSIRQKNTGALGGVLQDAIPGLAPLNKQYMGALNFSNKAADRAAGVGGQMQKAINLGEAGGAIAGVASGHPLAALPLIADTVPVKTGVGYGLYKAGQAAQPVANFITHPVVRPTPFGAQAILSPPKKKS